MFLGPILVDQLFHLVTANFPQEQWFKMFKTPNDLSTFLKLFSDCFHIQSNLVTLLQKPKLSEAYILQAQAQSKDQLNNNFVKNSTRTQSPQQLPIRRSPLGDFKLNEPVTCVSQVNNNNSNNTSEPNSGFDSSIIDVDVKLDNLCDNNCPSAAISSYFPNNSNNNSVNQTNQTPVQPTVEKTTTQATPQPNSTNQSLKQRINTLVIRTLAENMEKDKNTMSSIQSNHATNKTQQLDNTNRASPTPPVNNQFAGDTWKIKVLQNTRIIASIKESAFVAEAILKSASTSQVIISLDCEGVNLGIKGQLSLIKIGTTRGEAFLFDVLNCPEIITLGGLKNLLESPNVIKVVQDCRNDSGNLYFQFGIILRNVFDTQSAHSIIQYQESGKQVYKVKNLSLNALCELYEAPINPLKHLVQSVYKRDQKFWARRPLTRDMILYAAGEVLVLINERLYGKMAK